MFVSSATEVDEGMLVSENARWDFLNVKIVKAKKLTNTRAAGAAAVVEFGAGH